MWANCTSVKVGLAAVYFRLPKKGQDFVRLVPEHVGLPCGLPLKPSKMGGEGGILSKKANIPKKSHDNLWLKAQKAHHLTIVEPSSFPCPSFGPLSFEPFSVFEKPWAVEASNLTLKQAAPKRDCTYPFWSFVKATHTATVDAGGARVCSETLRIDS